MHVSASTVFENTNFEMFCSLFFLFPCTLYERRGFLKNWDLPLGSNVSVACEKALLFDIKAGIRKPHQRAFSQLLRKVVEWRHEVLS
jgi:hypothetical protein